MLALSFTLTLALAAQSFDDYARDVVHVDDAAEAPKQQPKKEEAPKKKAAPTTTPAPPTTEADPLAEPAAVEKRWFGFAEDVADRGLDVFAVSAERQPAAQNSRNFLPEAKTGLWYGLSGSTQNSIMPRGA